MLRLSASNGICTARVLSFVLLLLASAAPARSSVHTSPLAADRSLAPKSMPSPEEIALPHERSSFNELFSKLVTATDSAQALGILDASLAELSEPTKFRGYVQFVRAMAFLDQEKHADAMLAIDESIRLLPGYSAPLIAAASIYAYGNQPAKAADSFLRAAELDPDGVRRVDDYEVNNILRRLTFARDERRANAVSDRLLEIGWVGRNLGSQSSLARRAIERRLREDDVVGARALVPKLLVPSDSYNLLMVKRFSPIWDDVERWAGGKLERQWAMYLSEARLRWAASKAVDTIHDYTGALLAAGHYETVIRDIVPTLLGQLDQGADYNLIFVVSDVAAAVAHKGRWSEVDALFERTQNIWPLGSDANSLNIGGNRARYLMLAGKTGEALRLMDRVISEAQRLQVNRDAIGAMHHYRACMLHELGRVDEAGVSAAIAASIAFPAEVAGLHLCMGKPDAARRHLIEAMKNPTNHESVIGFVQITDDRNLPSEYSRKLKARVDQLRNDPAVKAAVLEHGRILDFRVNEGAPPELQ